MTTQEIPAHVPPELVHNIGLTESPEFLADPFKFMAGLHERLPPLFFSVGQQGTHKSWQLTKHSDVYFVLRHPEIFTTHGQGPFPRDPDNYFRIIPLEISPPEHRKYRAIVDPLVSPQAIAKLEANIRKLTNELIDNFIDRGECEFAKELGRPLPVGVFLDIMGLPRSMMDEFVRWAMGLLHAQDRAVAGQVMGEVTAYLNSAIAEKRANPDGGMVSAIVNGKPGGEPMSEREIFGFVFFVFIAGLDTVFAALNNIFVWLAENPERRREIIAEPENINNVIEELLRVYTVTFSGRVLTQDYEMHGVTMRKGDRITSILPTANYDPDVFPNPKEVNFHRPRTPTLSFAGGAHSCMGAHLARLEIKIVVQEFLRRIPEFKLAQPIEYFPGAVIGPKAVHLSWK